MVLYAALHAEGRWVKLGFATEAAARHARGYWGNSHPAELCNKLSPGEWRVIATWKIEDKAAEQELHRQFNGGGIHKNDSADEFYEILEFPKIKRELDTTLEAGDPMAEIPPNDNDARRRACCRRVLGDTFQHFCEDCNATFVDGGGWRKHRLNPPQHCQKAKRARTFRPSFGW